MYALVGSGVEPGQYLIVEVFQVLKMQPWPEISSHIFDSIFNLALRLWPVRLAGLWGETSHISKVQEAGIPMHFSFRVTVFHHTFEVIVEQPFGNAAQVGKCMQVTPDEPGGI